MNNIKLFRDFFVRQAFEPSDLCKEIGIDKSKINMNGSLENIIDNIIMEAFKNKSTETKLITFYNEQIGLKECTPLQYLQRKYDY